MAISKCGACRRVFGGVAGFDAHRRNGTCVHPVELGMVERDGVWRKPMTQAARERLNDIDSVRKAAER